MPICKIITSKSPHKNIEKYIKNPVKTNSSLYFGVNCNPDDFAQDFNLLQKTNKNSSRFSRTYYHVIISWADEPDITPAIVKQMTEEIWNRTGVEQNFALAGTVHYDNANQLHSHTAICNFALDGKSFQSTKYFRNQLMEVANQISIEHGYSQSIIDVNKPSDIKMTTAEAQLILKKHQLPWKDELRKQIDEAKSNAKSLEEFIQFMNEKGVYVQQDKNGELKYIPKNFIPTKNSNIIKPCHSRRLGAKYDAVSMLISFSQNMLQEELYKSLHQDDNERRRHM